MDKIIDKEKLTRLKAEFQYKYSYEMDDWSAMIMNEMRESFDTFNSSVIDATKKINGQVKQVNFENQKQAFWYGAGKTTPFSIAIIVFTITAFVLVNQSKKHKELSNFVNAYPQFESFRTLVKFGAIEKDENGKDILVLEAPKLYDRVTIGKEYQKIKKGKVYIPLSID